MKPVMFPEQNNLHVSDGCLDLPTYTVRNEQFQADEVTSCWEFEDSDIVEILKQIKDGIRPVVYLTIIGGQPPVKLSVENFSKK